MWFRRERREPKNQPPAAGSPAQQQENGPGDTFDAWDPDAREGASAADSVGPEATPERSASSATNAPVTDAGPAREVGGDSFGWGETADPVAAFVPQPVATAHAGPGRILVVCTGNICRSPYIERSLTARLEGTGIEVTSAGTGALVGEPIDPGSVALLDAAGVPSGGFAARQLTPEMVEQADLILTATRDHRRAAVQLAPVGLRKTFALIDLVDVLDGVTVQDVAAAAGNNAVQRMVSLAECRRAEVHARVDGADVVDPFREDASVFAQMQGQVDEPVARLAGLLRG